MKSSPAIVPFRERLAALLEERAISPAGLADRCEVARSTISRLLSGVRGVRPPTPDLLRRIALGLALTVDQLTQGTDAAGIREFTTATVPAEELAQARREREAAVVALAEERGRCQLAERDALALRGLLAQIRALAGGNGA